MLSSSALSASHFDNRIFVFFGGAYRVEIDLMQPIDPDKAPKVVILSILLE